MDGRYVYRFLSTGLLVGFLFLAKCEGSLNEVADRCCTTGVQWFTENRERCTGYASPIRGVADGDQDACGSIIQVCCLHEKQERQCQRGKQNARIRDTCVELHSQQGNEDARECCHCCKIGLLAREAGVACDSLRTYGPICDEVVQECCSAGGQGEVVPADDPATTPVPQTSAPVASGFCARFPDQLCAHLCIDTPGSYRCDCHSGFTLHQDGRTCNQNDATDRCRNSPCQHECVDTGLAIHCRCFSGYFVGVDGRSCLDVDECSVSTHSCLSTQRCVNLHGSYACEDVTPRADTGVGNCLVGYVYIPETQACEDINECALGADNCNYAQICVNTEGAFECQSATSGNDPASCREGLRYNSRLRTCEDINECATGTHTCTGDHQLCRNAIGSFYCTCERGFHYNQQTSQCEDINECALSTDQCLQGQSCENSIGSYVCIRTISCGTGYTLDLNTQRCTDDNECELGTHNCGISYECQNTEGSFRCVIRSCPLGYRLHYATGECELVICDPGLAANAEGTCADMNECLAEPSVCLPSQECLNTHGSYQCRNRVSCGSGYELNDLGTACVDIDECNRGLHDCRGAHMLCFNRPGTFMCQCPDGYRMNRLTRQCDDVDECEQYGASVCSQNAECENTDGSFVCNCKEGFSSDNGGRYCSDVDECNVPNICHHDCRNTWGSYACTCNRGWQLDEDARTCQDVDECALWEEREGSLCLGLCQNTAGSYSCSCPDGYVMLGDGRTCQDLDECALGTANCDGVNDLCINTRGDYKCESVSCPAGFVRAPSAGNRRNNNVRCQRRTFVCAQGDVECLQAPLSYSVNFITFPSEIHIPADLFNMRGPLSPYRRLEFELTLVSATDPDTGEQRVTRNMFNLRTVAENEVIIQLLQKIDGPQDIELKLDMKIYSREYSESTAPETFFGTAVARIKIYVTGLDW